MWSPKLTRKYSNDKSTENGGDSVVAYKNKSMAVL